ncbi:hypothetical protein [Lactiplantibacillus paraxiangfangensis]|uniref:hypothetical protein n=1 Tax=Lactiplantibacillus paraxiangfangensis TaxID=3076224 RepID=UPI0030C6CC23
MLSVTVKELIELLEEQDPDAPVSLIDSRTNSVTWLDDFDGEVVEEKNGIVQLIGS